MVIGLAEDSASDWWNFAVNVAIAVATLLAVFVSVMAARTANATSARLRRDEQEERARQAGEARRLDAVSWAQQQALDVRVEVEWTSNIEGNSSKSFVWQVHNDSADSITHVEVWTPVQFVAPSFDPRAFPAPSDKQEYGIASGSQLWGEVDIRVYPAMELDPIPVDVYFTDRFLNRWRIADDRSLLLQAPRRIGVETSGRTDV
jgi:hypothetical protein